MISEPRLLRANEIEVRPAHKVGDKFAMLFYIDSRAVTKYLNEWVGWNNWQTEFYAVNNQIVGKLGIWDETKNMWIWKSDVGSESNIEKEKGLFSDTYKRLLVRFGVTELYSAVDVLLPDDGYGNKGYKVSEILYNDNREITHITLVNRFGKIVYTWNIDNPENPPVNKPYNDNPSKSNIDQLTEFCADKKQLPDIDKDKLLRFFNYYKDKMNNWTGKLNLEQLFKKWMTN